MNDMTLQAAPEWGVFRRWYFVIAALLAALLLLLWLAGYGPGGARCTLPAAPVAAAPALAAPEPVSPATPATPAAPAASVVAATAAVPAAPPVAVAAAAATAAPATAAALPPAARVYFGLDKTALPRNFDQTLAEVVAYLKANGGAKVLLSGFHDPSGDKAHNEALALNRARAVRAQLDKLGIPSDRVEMAKPAETTGTGVAREARRVEVSVQAP